ncbi:MAG: metallophosphoesterase family protein [Cyanobacteria bacterium P01_H01_bin.15]
MLGSDTLPSVPRQIIIGDVHGHYDALMSLVEKIDPRGNDQLYFLGDLIDRGPQSADVVRFVMENQYPCLLGNHEEMLLFAISPSGEINREALQNWLSAGGNATLASYNNRIPHEHLLWLRERPMYLDLGDVWLAHAGVDPKLAIAEQTSEQFCWIRDRFHASVKPFFENKTIVTGHTLTFTLPGVEPGQLAAGMGWLDIETGAYHRNSGWLTGLDFVHHTVYQFNAYSLSFRERSLAEAVTPVDLERLWNRRRLRQRR